jgi:hypothetical protein
VRAHALTLAVWITPFNDDDRRNFRSWCDAVGPVVVHDPGPRPKGGSRPVTIVSWRNMAVGRGNLSTLLEEVRGGDANAEVILLLQEAYRAKTPPATCSDGSGRAGALGHRQCGTA